jgi:hypothetical protein
MLCLDLSYNYITDNGFCLIAYHLTKYRSIAKINITGNSYIKNNCLKKFFNIIRDTDSVVDINY